MSRKFLILLFFSSLVIISSESCERQKKNSIPTKTNADIELEKTKSILNQIGETTIIDTSRFKKFVYFGNSALSRCLIYCVKDLKDDSLSIVTVANMLTATLYYNTKELDENGVPTNYYSYLEKLKKVTLKQNRKKSTIIFNLFDSLVEKKLLLPIGKARKIDRSGDIVDGGSWILYYDGNLFYKFDSYYNNYPVSDQVIFDLFEKNIDFKPIVQELNTSY